MPPTFTDPEDLAPQWMRDAYMRELGRCKHGWRHGFCCECGGRLSARMVTLKVHRDELESQLGRAEAAVRRGKEAHAELWKRVRAAEAEVELRRANDDEWQAAEEKADRYEAEAAALRERLGRVREIAGENILHTDLNDLRHKIERIRRAALDQP